MLILERVDVASGEVWRFEKANLRECGKTVANWLHDNGYMRKTEATKTAMRFERTRYLNFNDNVWRIEHV